MARRSCLMTAMARGDLLEVTIVLLIVLEIVLALIGSGTTRG